MFSKWRPSLLKHFSSLLYLSTSTRSITFKSVLTVSYWISFFQLIGITRFLRHYFLTHTKNKSHFDKSGLVLDKFNDNAWFRAENLGLVKNAALTALSFSRVRMVFFFRTGLYLLNPFLGYFHSISLSV